MIDQKTHLETDVKQAKVVPGMRLVLAGSTLLAVLLMGAMFASAWS